MNCYCGSNQKDFMNVIYSCLFGTYEEIKPVNIITPGWRYILFTDQNVTSDIWEIHKVDVSGFKNNQLAARYFKIKEWSQWSKSMWIDASFVIDTDLNIWWEKHFKKGFSVPKHPLRNDVYHEGLDCIISKRGNREQIEKQLEDYRKFKVPEKNGVIQSGILMRENAPRVIELCKAWWKEVETYSARDQIAFCRVSIPFQDVIYTYDFDYRARKDFLYHLHFANRGGSHIKMSK